jgi:hypothetical protein
MLGARFSDTVEERMRRACKESVEELQRAEIVQGVGLLLKR